DRAALKALASDRKLSPAALDRFLASSKVTDEDRKAIESLAAMLTESHKWFTPRQLETAEVTVDGQRLKFDTWFRDLARKKGEAEGNTNPNAPKLTDVEKRAIEVGTRLAHYQAVRDRSIRSIEPLLVMPHPSNPSFLKFGTAALRKAKEKGSESLTLLELDSANLLWGYLNDLPSDEWETPGENKQFDDNFMAWIRKSSVWVPLRVLLDSKPEDLEKAGFPTKATSEFLAAYRDAETAEGDSPGLIAAAKSDDLLAKARGLGLELSKETYPTTESMDLEAHFNATNPFFKAPYGYGLALAFLSVSLLFMSVKKPSPLWWSGTAIYAGGLLGLIAGIGLEIQGFMMRVLISGWAPVTNMYETVIWVSLVSAVLGLVFELIYRKRFAALAGSGVALLGTLLAANTPLLDPGIRTLTP
ncbi:cytochrome c biogenesis protein, partial [Singulisphaera rosea]